MGIWPKPVAIEVEPKDGYGVRALARRGWKVVVVSEKFDGVAGERKIDNREVHYPDVIKWGIAEVADGPSELGTTDHVRFGSGTAASALLERWDCLPGDVVVRGPVMAVEMGRLRGLGFGGERRLKHREWPTGGPAASVLDHEWGIPPLAVSAEEDSYLTRRNPPVGYDPGNASEEIEDSFDTPSEEDFRVMEEFPWQVSAGMDGRLASLAGGISPKSIFELGPGAGTPLLRQHFPAARIRSIEHDASWFIEVGKRFGKLPRLELLHAPFDPALPWYDCREIEFGLVDLLVVHAGGGPKSKAVRAGAVSLRGRLSVTARVIIGVSDGKDCQGIVDRWLASGSMRLVHHDAEFIELQAEGPPDEIAMRREILSATDIAERTWVISLAGREDRRAELRENWQSLGLEPEWIDGIQPQPDSIRWEEMKGMEAYGKAENLRGSYVVGAVGCKRAGIAALRTFIESGVTTALICQDDCRWQADALGTIRRAFQELPAHWDLVYFSASARQPHEAFSPHLVRLKGARLCTAILWHRQTAMRLLPELERCDCEWDVFMQRKHAELSAFCVVPMPAYQGRSRSDITGGIVQPPNR